MTPRVTSAVGSSSRIVSGAFVEWRWRRELARTRERDNQDCVAYAEHLADRPALSTLARVHDFLGDLPDQ